MTILARLKEQTRSHHAALERQLQIELRCHSRTGYTQLLSCFYGFYPPAEAALAHLPLLDEPGLELARRRKSPLLAQDLRALGYTDDRLAQVERCTDLPQPATAAAGLGCLYVFEGATLGGQLIARQVAGELGLSQTNGIAFFTSYGREVGPMWRAFGAVLVAHADSAACEAEIIAAARATFVALERWIKRALP